MDIDANILKLIELSNTIKSLLTDTNDESLVKNYLIEQQAILNKSIDNILKTVDVNVNHIESLKLHDLRGKLLKKGINSDDDSRELRHINERLTFLHCEKISQLKPK
jgi:hypothetical protein